MTEAEILFSEVLGCDRASLYLKKDKYLAPQKADFIASVLSRRVNGEPFQYILGKADFMGLELKVNSDVLIPRPETELLVEKALEYIKQDKPKRILDLGTGSGCIAVALAKFSADLKIDASDISPKALAVAKENAKRHNAEINFIHSDLFSAINYKTYDIIISNPPYIAEGEIDHLQPELGFEPRMALSAGPDGLDFYRGIILESPDHLRYNGLLIMEIGFNQKKDLEKMFLSSGAFKIEEVAKDYNNIDRIIVARKVKQDG